MIVLVPETMSPKFRGHRLHCSKTLRGTGWRVQRSAGQRLRGPKLCGANIAANLPRGVLDPSTCAPQSFGPLNLCPAEFWSNATCAPQSFGDIVSGPKKKHKNDLKITFSFFFYGYFCKPLTFQRSIQPIWPLFREKLFCGTVPLKQSHNLFSLNTSVWPLLPGVCRSWYFQMFPLIPIYSDKKCSAYG